MKKLIIICIAFLTLCWSYDKYSLYGKLAKDDAKNGTINIAFDRYGDMYPEFEVDDNELRNNHACLTDYYNNDKQFSKKLNSFYGYKYHSFSTVQRTIAKKKAERVNALLNKLGYNSITLIMVGFNNSYSNADPKLTKLKTKIENYLAKKKEKSLIIKVFWDGRFNDPLKGLSFANTNSCYAGLGLREFLVDVKCENVVMISHSLGANLICETLFDQISKFTDHDDVAPYLRSLYKLNLYSIPKQKITAAIIAPAMPGKNTFIDYKSRQKNTFVPTEDNYKIIVGLNTNDEALNKYIGGWIKAHFSSTTLGCDRDEYNDVKAQFKSYGVPSNIDMVDFSYDDVKCTIPHKTHDLESYMTMPQYDDLLSKIYN